MKNIHYFSSDLSICSMAGAAEIIRIVDKIGLREIIDKNDPMKYDKEIKTSDIVMCQIITRICEPGSILNSIKKIKGSTIPDLLKSQINRLNEDYFYKRFKHFTKSNCDRIKEDVANSTKKVYNVNVSENDWDSSFVEVIGTQNELAAIGMNRSNPAKTNGIKISLLHARNNGNPIPLYQNVERGNTSDIELIKKDLKAILRYKWSLLVLDRFSKSDSFLVECAKDGILILTADRIFEKNIKEIKKFKFKKIIVEERVEKNGKVRVKKIKMKYVTIANVNDGVTIYKHIYIDPEKAKRDKKKRTKQRVKKEEEQKKLKELDTEGKLVKSLQKEFISNLKKRGIKANMSLKDIEFQEPEEKQSIDGLIVLSTTAKLTGEEALPTYRNRIWVEKGIKEEKQSHVMGPIYVRNKEMIKVMVMINFLAYLIACLLRLEHECFKKQSDNTIAEVLNTSCILVKQRERKSIILSKETAEKFGKFVNIEPKELKLNDIFGLEVSKSFGVT